MKQKLYLELILDRVFDEQTIVQQFKTNDNVLFASSNNY